MRRTIGIASLLVLTTLLSSAVSQANSSPTASATSSNTWAPYGPLTSQLQFKFYNEPVSEATAFLESQLDLPDVPCSASYPLNNACQYAQPCPPIPLACSTVITRSSPDPQFSIWGIAFNLNNHTGPGVPNTWASWGCNFQHGNSPCGIEIREAFAHLIDRNFAANIIGAPAKGINDPVSPVETPAGSTSTAQCDWETIPAYRNCISAFNLAQSPNGFAVPGSPDFCAAVAHLVAGGIGLTNRNNSCAIDATSPGLANIQANPIRFVVRNTDRARLALGLGLKNAINQLFGVTAVTVPICPVEIICINTVFGNPTGWDMYTYGFAILNPYSDHLSSLFSSQQASNLCGGPQVFFPENFAFICISSFDTYAQGASITNDPTVFVTNTLAALNEFGKHVANIPVFTPTSASIALTDMAGRVDQTGVGFSNFWSALNGRNATNVGVCRDPYPCPYAFGGGTRTLRWGQSQETNSLNPYLSYLPQEFNVIDEVYDTLFRPSPIQPTSILCWMCSNYSEYTDSGGNTHFLVEMRQNLRWQDGALLDAKDVKFSLLTLRDLASVFGASNLLDVQVLSPTTLDIKMSGMQVSHLTMLANVPILPRHIWELPGDTTYVDVGTVDPAKLSSDYDPITQGTFVGSGPFICRSIFPEDQGRVGSGCVQNLDGTRGGQAVNAGGTLTLQRYDMTGQPGSVDPFLQYMRSYNPAWGTGSGTAAFSGQFQEFTWADRYDNATVTILDVASVAACFGKTSPSGCADYSYWLRPAFHPGTPSTITSEVAIVATHLDDTWIYPFSWNGVQGQQPGQTLQGIVPFT